MTRTTDTLKDINQWLGWGDPKHGVWFVGIEEGATFTPEKISAMRGRRYYPVAEIQNRNWPVAIRTGKIVCGVTGYPDQMEYRQSKMGWTGSGVFNANMFPLGRPSLRSWPSDYPGLLGLTLAEYVEQRDALHAQRSRLFKKFRIAQRPQAIVCFGKSCWREFKALFVRTDDGQRADRRFDIFVFEADRIILTPHFARGSLMPNLAVNCVVKVLKRWNVSLPQ